jgi:uncharacterized protein (TIGR03437 family)
MNYPVPPRRDNAPDCSRSKRDTFRVTTSFITLLAVWVCAPAFLLRAQGVSFVPTANSVQVCTGDANQAVGATVLGVASAGTILANSSIIFIYGAPEVSGTPTANGVGSGSVAFSVTNNIVVMRYLADVAYVPGNFISVSGVQMATAGLSAGTNVPVSFSASSVAPSTSPITFSAPQRTVATMTSCDLSLDSGDQQISTVDTVLSTPFVVAFTPCMPGTIVTFATATGGGTVQPSAVAVNAQCKASTNLRLGTKAGFNTVTAKSVFSSSTVTFTAFGNPAAAFNMSILSGNNQTGTVGQPLALPLAIKVVDQFDNPVPRVPFVLDVIEGGGLLSFFTGSTETEGIFQTSMRLGNTPGTNTVRAVTPHLPERELVFSATAVPVVATNLVLISGAGQTGIPGQPVQPFVVRVVGVNALPIASASVNFAVTAGGGSLSSLQATTDANGIASSVLTLGPQQGVNTVTASAGTLIGSPITFSILGTASGQAPALFSGGVVNGASFRPAASVGGNVAPGTIVALFGSELAQADISAQVTPLPTTLGDTTVTFNGIAAPLFFVSPAQINAQAPWGLSAGEVAVRVRRGFLEIPSQSIQISSVSPGIFTANRQGNGAGAILHGDTFQPVSDASPTAAGRRIAVFLTGLGPVNPAAVTGQPAPSPAPSTVSSLLANIAGIPAVVEFSGLAPGFVGLYQVNLVVPAGTPAGNQDVQITMNGISSNTATVAVR